MIPKKIHYFWFSNEPYPPLIQKCIESWKKHLPEYEIILWNCENFDVNMNMWTSQAYEAKKYAFVTDYARLYILYHYGGIYLDSDVEVIRNFDALLADSAFFGFIAKPGMIEAETIGSEPKQEMIGKLLNYYEGREFKLGNNKYDTKILPEILYELFIREGMNEEKEEQHICDTHIYPAGYFLMSDDLFYLSYEDGIRYLKETYSLHYATGSWSGIDNKLYNLFKRYYLKYFWTICRFIKYPPIFKFWQIGINLYRKLFWGL